MKTYSVPHASQSIPLTGTIESTPWEDAPPASIAEFNWYETGPRPETTVRVLYDDLALYLQYHVEDHTIAASVTELNGPTYEDSCVEFFATPSHVHPDHYFNFEANCCGTFKLTWQAKDWQERDRDRKFIDENTASAIQVRTSESGPTREPRSDDESWWLAAKIPFSILRSLTGEDIAPTSETLWRGNFHRTGVESISQEASWNPIKTPDKRFHTPSYFGRIQFS